LRQAAKFARKETIMKKTHRNKNSITRKFLTLALILTLAVSIIPGAAAVNLLDSLFQLDFGQGKYSVYKVEIESSPVIFTNTVTYKPNGGTGNDVTVTVNRGSEHIAANQGYVRDGYSFNGWSTEPGGRSSTFMVGAPITVNADITLYARWERNTCTVTYNSLGGFISDSGSYEHVVVTVWEGEAHTVIENPYTLYDMEFVCWSSAQNVAGAVYYPGEQIIVNRDIILHARWIARD